MKACRFWFYPTRWASTPRYHGKAVLFAATQTLRPQWDIQALWSPYPDELEVHRLRAW